MKTSIIFQIKRGAKDLVPLTCPVSMNYPLDKAGLQRL